MSHQVVCKLFPVDRPCAMSHHMAKTQPYHAGQPATQQNIQNKATHAIQA